MCWNGGSGRITAKWPLAPATGWAGWTPALSSQARGLWRTDSPPLTPGKFSTCCELIEPGWPHRWARWGRWGPRGLFTVIGTPARRSPGTQGDWIVPRPGGGIAWLRLLISGLIFASRLLPVSGRSFVISPHPAWRTTEWHALPAHGSAESVLCPPFFFF